MTRSRLARGLVFALVAGATIPYIGVLLGGRGAACVMLFAVVVHLLVVAPELRRGLRAGALAATLALPCALLVEDGAVLLVLACVILSLGRSAVLYPRPFARALLAEVAFLALGAFAALVWCTPGSVSSALMAWSFWLVQAGFALLAESAQPADELPSDPFERARHIAEAVLAGRPRS